MKMFPPVCQYDFRNADLRGHGCTLASLTYAARWATDSEAWEFPEDYAEGLRQLSGVPLRTFRERGTTLTEGKVAFLKAPGFEGRVKPRYRQYRGGRVRDDLIPALESGNLAVAAVNYGAIQDAKKGVGSFRGGHAVVVGEPEDGKVTVADPLRRELVKWPIYLLVKAMETFGKNPWGDGRGEFAVVSRSPTLLEVRTQQRDAARRELAAIKGHLLATSVKLGEVTADLDSANARIAILESAQSPDLTAVKREARQSFKDEVLAIPA